jgi:hypothetical protein
VVVAVVVAAAVAAHLVVALPRLVPALLRLVALPQLAVPAAVVVADAVVRLPSH